MKLNLCTIAIASMVLGVTARPGTNDGKTHGLAVHKARGMPVVGDLIVRRARESRDDSEDDDDDDEDEDEDSSDSDESSDDSSDSESYGTYPGSGSYPYAMASKTASSSPSATGSAGGSATTQGTSTGSSGGSSGGSMPEPSGSTVLSEVKTIAAGEHFDGGMAMFDSGVSCDNAEGGDPVFDLQNGASISNVIIGPNQVDGIHCQGACTLTNVWWSAVCEDAFTIKNQAEDETTIITGGGASGAQDKVLQHNGAGTLDVSGFTVSDFGKLYRSCGNCKSMYERHVKISDCTASNGDILAGINSNYGDTAEISGVTTSGVDTICEKFEGNSNGDEPTSVGSGNDGTNCIIE